MALAREGLPSTVGVGAALFRDPFDFALKHVLYGSDVYADGGEHVHASNIFKTGGANVQL